MWRCRRIEVKNGMAVREWDGMTRVKNQSYCPTDLLNEFLMYKKPFPTSSRFLRKKLWILSVLILSSVLCSLSSFPPSAHAQENPFDLTISPPITHVVIKPGKTAIHTINIKNNGNRELELSAKLVDFTSDNQSGVPVLLDRFTFEYVKLIKAEIALETPFKLAPGDTEQFVLQFEIPESAMDKEYHFSLLVSAQLPEAFTLGNSTAISGRIASNLIVNVSRDGKDRGFFELAGFQTTRVIDSLQAISLELFLKNTGKTISAPTGELQIYDTFGRLVKTFTLLPENVLPSATREIYAASLAEQSEAQSPQFLPEAFSYKPSFLLGRYTLELSFHSPTQTPVTTQYTLYAFPFSLLVFFSLAVFGVMLYQATLGRGKTSKQEKNTSHDSDEKLFPKKRPLEVDSKK